MRIEEIVARDYSQQGNHGRQNSLSLRKIRQHHAVLLHCDSFEMASTSTTAQTDSTWLVAYVRLIPEELAAERVRKALSAPDKTDALFNILLFEVL